MSSFQSSASAAMPTFEDLFEDLTFPLTIPPLKSMFPESSSERIMTLEPSTSISIDNATAKLTGRQLALAQAKTIEAPTPNELEALAPKADPEPPTRNPLEEYNNKKRRKLANHEQIADFVHLPKPKPKLEDVNRKPFRPIAVLHQLNEPPPSAALFPPITPTQDEHDTELSTSPQGDAGAAKPATQVLAPRDRARRRKPDSKQKKTYTRGRTKWTEEETRDLMEGVAICGIGRWKDILEHPKFHFNVGRTHVDLKDRFRVLHPQKNAGSEKEEAKGVKQQPQSKYLPRRQQAPKRAWSEEEDFELEKGFKQYGFQWHLIAQDQSLEFDDRSAHQIRDRFRRLHPEEYEKPPPAQPQEKPKRIRKKGRLSSKSGNFRPHAADTESSNRPMQQVSKATTPLNFPSGLLNGSADEEDNEFTKSLAALDDPGPAPVQWDMLAVQPMFEIS